MYNNNNVIVRQTISKRSARIYERIVCDAVEFKVFLHNIDPHCNAMPRPSHGKQSINQMDLLIYLQVFAPYS